MKTWCAVPNCRMCDAAHECLRFSYREAGAVVWRRCLTCHREERGKWVGGISVAGGREYRDGDSCPTCQTGTLERRNVILAVDRRRGLIQCERCGTNRHGGNP